MLAAVGAFFIFLYGMKSLTIELSGKADNDTTIVDSVKVRGNCHAYVFDSFIPVNITSYNPEPSQCDFDPFTTADGSKITDDTRNWCAVSRDLLFKYFDFGDTLCVIVYDDGFGCPMYFNVVIHDVTAKHITNTVDLLFLDPKQNFTGRGEILEVRKSTKKYIFN